MSGRGVRLVVVVGLLLVFSVLPCSSLPATSASGVRWLSTSSPACDPWRIQRERSGSVDCSFNKLVGDRQDLEFFLPLVAGIPIAKARKAGSEVHLVRMMQVRPLSSPCVDSYRGGRGTTERRRSSSQRRLESSKFSPALVDRRWRLLKPPSFGSGGGGRWPADSSPAATFLAEWRPTLFLPAMMPLGRQYGDWLVAMAPGDGSCGAPSGSVPRRQRSASRSEAEDLIAFFIFCLRSFLQSPGTALYFTLSSGFRCKMCRDLIYE